MNDSEDDEKDWGEPERRARLFDRLGEVMERMRNKQYVPVRLANLHAGWRFDVTTFSDGHATMEFTLLDPGTGRVRVIDNFYFVQPTECVLIGSEDALDGHGATLSGVVKYNAKLVIELNGQRLAENGPELRIMRLMIHIPGSEPLNPWPQ